LTKLKPLLQSASKVNVNVFCIVAWLIPSLALNVNVAAPSNPNAVAESSVLGVIVTTEES